MRISDWSSDVCSSDLGQRKHGSDRNGTEVPACGNLSLAGMCDRMSLPNRIMVLTSNRSIMPLCASPANMNEKRLIDGFHPGAAVYAAHRYCASRRGADPCRSEEHTSELQSLMRISYAVFCLKKKTTKISQT